MSRRCNKLIIAGIVGFATIAFFGLARAHAYALPGTTGATPMNATASFNYGGWWESSTWQNLAAPFQNFTHSLQSIGTINLGITSTMSVFSDTASQSAHGVFEQFDSWLAGIIGFHINQIITVALQLISWLLGIVKNGIDWALSWIH
jgi:hypothetical protein